jgi:type IV pilus assembly protein PilO
LAALGTGVFLVLPSWTKLQEEQAQLIRLRAVAASIPQFRRRIERAEQRQQNAQLLQSKLLSLIAGSGDISTFLAQIGAEASRSGVQLDSYEPNLVAASAQPGASPAAPAAPPAAGQAPAQPDPLLAPGLQKTSLLITAHGPAPNLLTFLRRLEALSLLVVQSDLSLKQAAGAAPASSSVVAQSTTTLKLNLTLYSKQAAASAPQPPTPARS